MPFVAPMSRCALPGSYGLSWGADRRGCHVVRLRQLGSGSCSIWHALLILAEVVREADAAVSVNASSRTSVVDSQKLIVEEFLGPAKLLQHFCPVP